MDAKGKKLLRIAGTLELIFGIGMIGILFLILTQGNETTMLIFGNNPNVATFFTLAGAYAQAIAEILAGVIGILFATHAKHYKICKFFGILLILIVSLNFFNMEYTLQSVISQLFALVVPTAYYYGAIKNQQSL